MKVRITSPQGYSDRYGDVHRFGDHVEYPEILAEKLIRHGLATRVHETREVDVVEAALEPSTPEDAVVAPPKRAVKPKPRARRG